MTRRTAHLISGDAMGLFRKIFDWLFGGSKPEEPKKAPVIPPGWPEYPDSDGSAEYGKALYDAQLELAKARVGRNDEVYKLALETENELFKSLQEQIRTIGATRVARRDTIAESVQKASAAVVTLYTGLLGFVFAVGGTALPARALIPALFLGGSVALSTAYVAFVVDPRKIRFDMTSMPRPNVWANTTSFIVWASQALQRDRLLIRCAVVSLAIGLAFLPAPFVSVSQTADASNVVPAAWPSVPPAQSEAEAALAAIVLQAQVDEVAQQRADQLKPGAPDAAPSDAIAFSLAGWAVLISLVILIGASIYDLLRPPIMRRLRPKTGREPGAQL
ncbi:MAG: hypothetical protein WD830_03940 [Chloroflexota bacterium]